MGGARRTLDRRRGGRKDMCSVLRSISFPAGAVPRLLRARVVLVVVEREYARDEVLIQELAARV